MLILRIAILFQPLKIFFPLGFSLGFLGVLKIVFDIMALFQRHAALSLDLLYQPVISTSAILLVLAGMQLLLIGMVADALLKRFPRYQRETNPYQEVWLLGSNVETEGVSEELMYDAEGDVPLAYRQLTRSD